MYELWNIGDMLVTFGINQRTRLDIGEIRRRSGKHQEIRAVSLVDVQARVDSVRSFDRSLR